MPEDNETFHALVKKAEYALNSHSRDLVNETYGMAKMARVLEAITADEFMHLNTMLIRNGLNNPAGCPLD